jgi:hypothetical protein
MPRGTSIEAYRPEWLSAGERHRYQMGMAFTCPTHGEPCRLEVWFANPADGDGPIHGKPLYWRYGAMLIELTVSTSPSSQFERALTFPGHWIGWIAEGRVYDAMSGGP